MSLEKMKKELELQKVKIAKQEMELKIEERMEDVRRLKSHIKIQDEKIQELHEELKALRGDK